MVTRFCLGLLISRHVVLLSGLLAGGAAARFAAADEIDFNRDIRPILSERCYTCHGPDEAAREAALRLDDFASATADRGGYAVIVPHAPERSELLARVHATDATRMPPVAAGAGLSRQEAERLRQWVAEGASYRVHWALEPPRRPRLPTVENTTWAVNPIDRFILARLEAEGLAPNAEADRATLIRRVSLDLTGLPPTPDEVDDFLADPVPGAYERLVDRLLASSRYGERMALPWLYAARYADTNGYQSDGPRIMWRWRDWVVEAFNANQPFDQFTLEQLAGDLLPEASLAQKVATGFNRNHRGNAEGGIIAEEYLVEYAVDRVETMSTVWLGLTIGCARCHDHKYDPISQREFYQLLAYFNSIPEMGKVIRAGNSPPAVKSPTPAMQAELDRLDAQIAMAQAQWRRQDARVADAQRRWEPTLGSEPLDYTVDEGLAVALPAAAEVPNTIAMTGGGVTPCSGVVAEGYQFDGQGWIDLGDVASFDKHQPFTLSAWIRPASADGVILARIDPEGEAAGYELVVAAGRLQFNLINRRLDDALRVETLARLEVDRWQHVTAVYDGTENARAVSLYIDGQPQKTRALIDTLSNSITNDFPLLIGSRGQSELAWHGCLGGVRIYDRRLSPGEAGLLATSRRVDQIAALPPDDRTALEAAKLRTCFLERFAPQGLTQARQQLARAEAERQQYFDSIPTTMVMQELPEPRPTYLLVRGAYDRPADRVERGVPNCLPPLPADGANDRLRLARWLVAPDHPLTARVAVNRFWELSLGRGLVETAEDFGSQGQPPTHPELLDWLAREFVDSGWNVKALMRLIVTSATYRQSSNVSPLKLAADPANKLLARGTRVRLPAELIRDQALAASGLLVDTVGGPSVKPYQPAGVWEEIGNVGVKYVQDHGAALYRRSLYTFWKRTAPPPGMMTFDATSREVCSVGTSRTNTPLQALNLMNDVTFVEAARLLAWRAAREAGPELDAQLERAFRLVLCRRPTPEEMQLLRRTYQRQYDHYATHPDQAEALLAVGESRPDFRTTATPSHRAALATVGSLILNLDEAITRE